MPDRVSISKPLLEKVISTIANEFVYAKVAGLIAEVESDIKLIEEPNGKITDELDATG